jgi:D-alanyl-lipoteichoic acid acyltransferase DltB (MBOAT superfamily)
MARILYCWRCRTDVPMLDEAEWAQVFALLDGVLALVVAAFGRAVPPVNRAPYLATSLSDFWSRRWNSIINTLLREHVYRPFAGRGAIVAMTWVFAASAALHAYLVGMLLGVWATLAWTVFFLVQALGMWLERRVRVRRWPKAWGHAWTLGWLLVLYPLFVEPLLMLLEQL